MMILVINCGSSSAKYELFDMKKDTPLARGIIERIGKARSCPNHRRAIEIIKQKLPDAGISGIGHRVVHGGERFEAPTLITKKVTSQIEKFSALAPLHNPPSLLGIKACLHIFRGIPQVACFDTAFHRSMPDFSYIYALPYRLYKKYGIRRYGFHGTSHRYVAEEAQGFLKKSKRVLKIITVHLGNGCSMTAVDRGKSVDTSMGLTPLEGLVMGTRSGDLDPAIITFLMRKEHLGYREIDDILNKKSGLLGISGISNDMRDILRAVRRGNKRARLALDIFIYRIKKYIGAYAAVMDGVDAIVFTGGIGENVPQIKNQIKKELRGLLGNKTRFLTIPTNEELLIARDTYKVIKTRR